MQLVLQLLSDEDGDGVVNGDGVVGLAAAAPARENSGTGEDREASSDAVPHAHQPRVAGVCLPGVGHAAGDSVHGWSVLAVLLFDLTSLLHFSFMMFPSVFWLHGRRTLTLCPVRAQSKPPPIPSLSHLLLLSFSIFSLFLLCLFSCFFVPSCSTSIVSLCFQAGCCRRLMC